MRRKALWAIGATAVIVWANAAFGIGITAIAPYDTASTTQETSVFSLSKDGTLVGGYSYVNNVKSPVSWDMTSPGSPVAITAGTFGSAGVVTGIGRSTSSIYTSGTGGPILSYYGNTATWSGLYAHTARYDRSIVSGYNSTAITADGGDQWIAGGGVNASAFNSHAYLWLRSNGISPKYDVLGTTSARFNSVASTGRCVGYDTPATPGTKVPIYYNPGGTITPMPKLAAPYDAQYLDGQGSGISDDAAWLCGYGKPTRTLEGGGTQKAPTYSASMRWNYDTGAVELLRPLEGMEAVFQAVSTAGAAQAIALDIAPDGLAVGYDWTNELSDRAAFWFPGQTTATLLLPYLQGLGVDTTGWSNLGRAMSVTNVGGDYIIAGNGTYNGGTRAFYVVIPEPATMLLLALASLLVVRRRR